MRTAANAMDALAELERIPADVVITDIIMPKINGVQAIELICKAFPTIRIIAISGGGRIGNSDFLKIARHLGAMAVIAKPFDADELLALVKDCLAKPA